MKVQITNEAKQYLTLAEMPNVREIIADCKNDEHSAKDWAVYAARLAFEDVGGSYCGNTKVLEVTAEITRHKDYEYSETNKGIDVWVRFTAYNGLDYFVIGGIYLSDIWQIGDEEINEEIKQRMFIRHFKENR